MASCGLSAWSGELGRAPGEPSRRIPNPRRSNPTLIREGRAMKEAARAVVLLSGGLDSTTTLAEARAAGFELNALTIRYGQRHAVELEAARRGARALRVAPPARAGDDPPSFRGRAPPRAPGGPPGRPARPP